MSAFSLISRLEDELRVVVESLVAVICFPWRRSVARLDSFILVCRHNVPAAAPGILGYVAIAALEYAGPLPLLLAILGGVTGHDDANNDDTYASENCVNPVIVHLHHTSLAINFFLTWVVAFSGFFVIPSVLPKLAAKAVEVLCPINIVVLHIVY